MPHQIERALTFLNRDPLKNIVPLKMLHAYGNTIRCYYTDRPTAGVLLLLPTQASPFDRQTYPSSRFIVLLSTTDIAVTEALLPHVPKDCRLVFKLMDTHDRAAVEEQFHLRRITAYLSYTCPPTRQFARSPLVRLANTVDTKCQELYTTWGYSLEEVQPYFASEQALSFALYQDDTPLSACFAFLDFANIWEIGGVYTAPNERRKGYAHTLVETTLHVLLAQQRLPRYQVHESNLPSIHLAKALGLHQFLTTEHFLYDPDEQQ